MSYSYKCTMHWGKKPILRCSHTLGSRTCCALNVDERRMGEEALVSILRDNRTGWGTRQWLAYETLPSIKVCSCRRNLCAEGRPERLILTDDSTISNMIYDICGDVASVRTMSLPI